MAEGMFRTHLADHGARADIGSAGLWRGGAPPRSGACIDSSPGRRSGGDTRCATGGA
jgi:hypothetical protein